jgi:hypothetical protein
MKRAAYFDKDEMELAKSLQTEEWISDLTRKEKKQYEEYARNSLTPTGTCLGNCMQSLSRRWRAYNTGGRKVSRKAYYDNHSPQ